MSGAAVIAYLLENDAGVLALVPALQIFAGDAPERTPLPILSVMKVSGVERPTVAMTESQRMRTERVQVSVATAGRSARSQLLELVRAACRNRKAVVNGIDVLSILPGGEGPDDDDQVAEIYCQPIDFIVQWRSA